MSNKIIYLKSYDIILRHVMSEIISLEKQYYDIEDLEKLNNLIDLLQGGVNDEISNNSKDHSKLCLALQGLDDEFANKLIEKITIVKAPYTSKTLKNLLDTESSLMKDIDVINKNNAIIANKIKTLKEELENTDTTAKKYSPELVEEANAIIERLNANTDDITVGINKVQNKKLIKKYQDKIQSILTNKEVKEQATINNSKWLKQYNINFGLTGSDYMALIKMTNQINDLYASINDTSDYEAMKIFAQTVLDTINEINEVNPIIRKETLNNNIDEIAEQQEEVIKDKITLYKGMLNNMGSFSEDNYQFNENDIVRLQNMVNTADAKINELIAANEAINNEIEAKKNELAAAKEAYKQKHKEDPDIEPVNENQPPKTNDEGISEIVEEISDVISQELPYISQFNIDYDDTEIALNEPSRSRIITITDIYPELHKDAVFTIVPGDITDLATHFTWETSEDENQLIITANGTGDIKFFVSTGDGEHKVVTPVQTITVEPNEISDFNVNYDNDIILEKDNEMTISVDNIEPSFHKNTPFELVITENDNSFELIEFNAETGETKIKATGLSDKIEFMIKNGEVEKLVSINSVIYVDETITWYIGKNENNILGLERFEDAENPIDPDYMYHTYNFDINSLPTAPNPESIYTDNQLLENIEDCIFIVCPEDLVGSFELKDMDDNNIVLTDETAYANINIDMTGYKLLMTAAEITDTVIRIIAVDHTEEQMH